MMDFTPGFSWQWFWESGYDKDPLGMLKVSVIEPTAVFGRSMP